MSLDGCLSSTLGTAGPGPQKLGAHDDRAGGLHWEPKAKLKRAYLGSPGGVSGGPNGPNDPPSDPKEPRPVGF